MSEKRGFTGKLKYDFNTAWVCEILMNDKWFRVIERDFRSFNGPRRLTKPNAPVLGNVHVGSETFDYEGPYYYWNTNQQYNPKDHIEGKVIQLADMQKSKAERTSVAGL
jgi:hypothetical protein